MILDQAIDRYTNNAEYERTHGNLQGYLEFKQLAEWLKDYKRLLEQQPCEEAVSREAALEKMADYVASGYADSAEDFEEYSRIICQLPSVTPKPIECDDAISREDAIKALQKVACYSAAIRARMIGAIEDLPPVTQKSGHCKECKYFEYDSVAKVDGIPLIVAHEICNKWGDGCKTSEDGYCYLFEPQESEDKE